MKHNLSMKSNSFIKLVDWPQLLSDRHAWRHEGKRVIWTNGCFDLFHVGHLRSLQHARALGDVLVVGLNSDLSVRHLKGTGRPVLSESDRAELLAGFECVDRVILFDETTPEKALSRLKPDIHCKGADYAPGNGKNIPEASIVESYGGQVCFLPLVPGVSTTELIRRIHKLQSTST